MAGLPPGEFSLLFEREGFKPFRLEKIMVEPSGLLYIAVSLERTGHPDIPPAKAALTDLADSSSQTILDSFQVEALPSGNNLWSLLENQDFSATTNRIDVGGVWADIPALWSSRGGSSWTQTTYLLNGLEVTEPYTRGRPLFFPDFLSIRFMQHSNGRHPISYLSPGGYLDLTPKQGYSEFHGAVAGFLSTKGMTTKNITPALKAEGLSETHRLNSFQDYHAQFSGPLLPGRLFFFTSAAALHLSRDLAEFEGDDEASLYSGLVNLTYRSAASSLQFFWTGQALRQPTYGAGRKVPLSATLDRKNLFNVFQVFWRIRLQPHHFFQLAASFSHGNTQANFQKGERRPHELEIFTRIPSGAAAAAGRDDRTSWVFHGQGEALLGNLARFHHRLEYGLSLQYALSSSEEKIFDNVHLHFVDSKPFEIIQFLNAPSHHRERALHLDLFVQETLTLSSLASFSFGLHLASSRGWVPADGPNGRSLEDDPSMQGEGGKVNWLNLSPRLGLTIPLLRDKSLILRIFGARYYYHLPLSYLTYGNPQALGLLARPWTDANENGQFEEGEAGEIWRREGPYFARIDADLKRPYADEYSITLAKVFRKDFYLTLTGYYREIRNLVETLNVGVPLSAYDPVSLYDPGDDFIPGTHDDLNLTVFNQRKETLGGDFFLLSNPEADKRISRYRGLDLNLTRKFGRSSVFFLSLTATEAIGTTSPGNTEQENDDGLMGSLYDNPNASLFARGRLRFDRAYTARLGLSIPIPLGFRFGTLVKYYDGQPFSRKIIVTGLNQGPFYVQAFYRGQARYEFNMTVDIRLEKSFRWGRSSARVFLDGYNVFNWALATAENEWTGPDFTLRYATEIQSPRLVRLGFAYEF